MFLKLPSNNNKYLNFHYLDFFSKEQILDYNYFYQKNYNQINKKINFCKFRPHKLWNNWNKNYFLSISHNRILDLTAFGNTKDTSFKISNAGANINFLDFQVNIQKKGIYYNDPSFRLEKNKILIQRIKKYFKNPVKNIKNYIIIGSGSAYEVITILKNFPKVKIAIIDLPEIINSGYLTIKNFKKKIKINLPDKAKKFSKSDAQINFYFPYQTNLIDEKFEIGNNMGSFQEMNIEVVNNYLKFIYNKMKKNGIFISINQENSRYIKGNSLKNYKLKYYKILNKDNINDHINYKILTLKKT